MAVPVVDSWLHTLVADQDIEALRDLFTDPAWRQYIDEPNEYGQTPLAAMIRGYDGPNPEILKMLLDMGADPDGQDRILSEVTRPDVALTLLQYGANPSDISSELKRAFLGIDPMSNIAEVSQEDFNEGKRPHFGADNPTKVYSRYREAMIRCGWNGYCAREHFGEPYRTGKHDPIWCMDRIGQSLTPLPGGRIILIGGEHEDFYDPDFCIYNDVIVFHPGGEIEMYAYPREVFPPTDFHTATLFEDYIYIIGRLGYREDRKRGRTPVYRLNTTTYEIKEVISQGDSPGRIYDHRATLIDGCIQVEKGYLSSFIGSVSNHIAHLLDLRTMQWSRLPKEL